MVQSTIMSVFNYGDILYKHASSIILKALNVVFHSALRFITGDGFLTHHCVLYINVGSPSLAICREQHCLAFIYKALTGKLPPYHFSLLHFSRSRSTCSSSFIRLDKPCVNTEAGKKAFSYFAPDKLNRLQDSLKLNLLISVAMFKNLLDCVFHMDCTCFL